MGVVKVETAMCDENRQMETSPSVFLQNLVLIL